MRRIKRNADEDDSQLNPFQRLVKKARRGDSEASAELKATLDQNPELWRELGDLAAMARAAVIKSLANGDPLLQESVQRKATELERSLIGDHPAPLLRLAVQRFVAVWLQLQHADAALAGAADASLQQVKFLAGQQDRAARRYERAMKTLILLSKRNTPNQDKDTGSDQKELDAEDVLLRVAGRA